MSTPDPWIPTPLRVLSVRRETGDTVTLELDTTAHPWPFQPGQFDMLYVFGVGEAAISISGDPGRPERLAHTIRGVGSVTRPLTDLAPGAVVGVRGPFGSAWPVQAAVGRDVLIVAGGIGLAPLRPAVQAILARRQDYGRVTLLVGARAPSELLFLDQLHAWRGRFDIEVEVTVDRRPPDWFGPVGVVTRLFDKARFDPEDTLVMTCGPEIMMRFVAAEALKRGVPEACIHLSMERNMRCAIGLCGHCQWGPHLLCRDGPVLPYDRVAPLLPLRGL